MGGSVKSYELQDGTTMYGVRYYAPDRKSGKRKQKYKGGFQRKKDAQAFLTSIQYKINNNDYVSETNMSLEEFLLEWVDNHVATLEPTTQESYKNKINAHIIPHLGHMHLQKLTTGQLNSFYEELLENGRIHISLEGASGLSVTTVKQIKKILSSAFNRAMKDGLASKNPVTDSEIPKDAIVAHRKADNYYTQDQLNDLLIVLKGTVLELPVKLAAYTGLRRGELLGLTWDNVETKTGKIKVLQALYDNRGAGKKAPKWVLGTPKTKNSIREIYMPDILARELEKYRQKYPRILPAGEMDFVFQDHHGYPFKPGDFSRRFTDQIKKHKLPYLTVHGLRHTFATLALSIGQTNIYEVSKVLGHSSISITSDTYGHLVSETGKKMAATMDNHIKMSK